MLHSHRGIVPLPGLTSHGVPTERLPPQGDLACKLTADAVFVDPDACAESAVLAVLFCLFGIGLD